MWLKFGDDVYQKLIMLQNPLSQLTVYEEQLQTNVQFKNIYDTIDCSNFSIKELHTITKQIHPSFISHGSPSDTADNIDKRSEIMKLLFNAISLQFLYLNSSFITVSDLKKFALSIDPDVDLEKTSSEAIRAFILSHQFHHNFFLTCHLSLLTK